MEPGSMRADDRSLVGWGVAVGAYPASVVAEIVRLSATADGDIVIQIGAHEMGQGIRTAIAAIVVRKLGVPADRVRGEIGDTRGVPQHLTAGSWGTASVVPAASAAADAMLKELNQLSPSGLTGRTPAQVLKAAGRSTLEVETRSKGPGQPDDIYDRLKVGQLAIDGPIYPGFVTFSYVIPLAGPVASRATVSRRACKAGVRL